ncbi:C1 family peptidase [Elusimicrobiota bacterium]
MVKCLPKIIIIALALCLYFTNIGAWTQDAYEPHMLDGNNTGPLHPSELKYNSRAAIDLSYQWASPPQKQGPFGFCHIFSAVGLIEAAYYRKFGRTIKFSEKWAASQIYATTDDVSLSPGVSKIVKWLDENPGFVFAIPNTGDGGNVDKDFELIKDRGLCKNDIYPYWDTSNPDEQKLIDDVGSFKLEYILIKTGAIKQLTGNDKEYELPEPIGLQKLHNKMFFDSEGSYDACKDNAAHFKEIFKDLKLKEHYCDIHNRHCRNKIRKFLAQGMPMAVSIRAYPWTTGSNKYSHHATIINGFDPDNANEDNFMDYFTTRNSWGEDRNYPIGQFDLERTGLWMYTAEFE